MSNVVDEVIQYLVDHRQCQGCGSAFRPENVHVLNQPARWAWDLGAVCHHCHTLTVVSAVVRADGQPRPAKRRLLELTPAERSYFSELQPVGMDDVLDLAHFLDTFDGDFRGLFSRGFDEP